MKSIEGMWDILYLGACHVTCKDLVPNTYQIYTGGRPLCLHSYIINRKGAEIILNETIPIFKNNDDMYRHLIDEGKIKAKIIFPPIFVQNREELGSNLGNNKLHSFCKEYKDNEWNIMLGKE